MQTGTSKWQKRWEKTTQEQFFGGVYKERLILEVEQTHGPSLGSGQD